MKNMNRKIIAWVLFTSTIVLASCGMKDVTNLWKKETPTDVIKELQTNLVDSIDSTVMWKSKLKWNSNLDINVVSPYWNWDLSVKMISQWVETTWEVNLDLNGSFDVKIPTVLTWNVSWKLDVISTLSKIYVNLEKFNITSSNPEFAPYNMLASKILNKWFYIENNVQTQNLTKVLAETSFKDELSKYSLLKVTKEISDHKYNVILDKDNLATVIKNISKKIDPAFSGSVEEIKDNLWSGDIVWTLEIENNNKYFTFSWNIVNTDSSKVPFNLSFTKEKIYFAVLWDKFVLDLNRDGDSFKWYTSFNWWNWNSFKLDINWKLTNNEMNLWLSFDNNWILLKINLDWKYEEINNVNISLPENAISIQDLQNGFGQ